MQNYTLKDAKNRHDEIFRQAKDEPVVLSEQFHPSYVIMSFQAYRELCDRLDELEDLVWGKQATDAVKRSRFVGEDEFVKSLQELANA